MRFVSVYDAFAPVYSDWSADMTEDVPFYVELARETDGPLVELAVGTGRVAIPVALARARRGRRTASCTRSTITRGTRYGWFDRRPFADDSREFVWITRKPA